MTSTAIIELAAAAIGGGVITQLLNFFLNKRKEDRVDFDVLLKAFRDDNEYLRKLNSSYHEKVEALNQEVTELKSKISMLESRQKKE